MSKMLQRTILTLAVAPFLVATAAAQNMTFNDVVKKVQARVEPAIVKRGATVNWTLTIEVADGWHTYPTRQIDPKSNSYVNRLKFAEQSGAVFVGDLKEPIGTDKDEDGAKVTMIEGTGTWERTIVIRPDAKPGKVRIKVPVTILACADRCLPPKTITTEIELTISDDPPVAVDPKYQKDLESRAK
jgi:DsbC/DsbD-like thiol-disulfide interchange protein